MCTPNLRRRCCTTRTSTINATAATLPMETPTMALVDNPTSEFLGATGLFLFTIVTAETPTINTEGAVMFSETAEAALAASISP